MYIRSIIGTKKAVCLKLYFEAISEETNVSNKRKLKKKLRTRIEKQSCAIVIEVQFSLNEQGNLTLYFDSI